MQTTSRAPATRIGWVRALKVSRPVMWIPTLLAYLAGVQGFSNTGPLQLVELVLFAFPLNYYLYGLNDAYDVDTDRVNARKGDAQGVLITDAERDFLLKTYPIAPVAALGVAAVSGRLEHLAMMAVFVACCFGYSHPVLRAKGIPVLDAFFSAGVYLSPILVAFTAHGRLDAIEPSRYALLLPAAGVHAISTATDYVEDRAAGIRTTAVKLGPRGAYAFAIASFAAPMFFLRHDPTILAVLATGMLFASLKFVPDQNQSGQKMGDLGGTVFAILWAVLLFHSIFVHNVMATH